MDKTVYAFFDFYEHAEVGEVANHPWDALDPELKVGDKVKGKVVVMADYGAFLEVAPGVEGLIHVSETPPRSMNTP